MSYTNITKPDAGSATRKTTVDALIDNDAYFQSVLGSVSNIGVANGSFEFDTDADGYPDQWTWSAQTNGAGVVLTSINGHGDSCFRITQTSGGSDGGGTLTSSDYFEVSEYQRLTLQWLHYNTRAAALDKVQIQFYTSALASISTTTLYSSTANPTAWALQFGMCIPPATARFAKIIITGSDSSSTGASVSYWDDFKIFPHVPAFPNRKEFTTAGTHSWICPAGVRMVYVQCIGGGGGGGESLGLPRGGGGGGGGMVYDANVTVPGTEYSVVVGAAGTGAGLNFGGADGTAGGNSTFGSKVANGGAPGSSAYGSGGAGGAGGSYTGNIGATGTNGTANDAGGNGPDGAKGGVVTGSGTQPTAPSAPGAGGAGGYNKNGGNGSNGRVIIEWA